MSVKSCEQKVLSAMKLALHALLSPQPVRGGSPPRPCGLREVASEPLPRPPPPAKAPQPSPPSASGCVCPMAPQLWARTQPQGTQGSSSPGRPGGEEPTCSEASRSQTDGGRKHASFTGSSELPAQLPPHRHSPEEGLLPLPGLLLLTSGVPRPALQGGAEGGAAGAGHGQSVWVWEVQGLSQGCGCWRDPQAHLAHTHASTRFGALARECTLPGAPFAWNVLGLLDESRDSPRLECSRSPR